MGIELVWEEENGKELARLGDPQSLVEQLLPAASATGFSFLRFVDPYGDTIFNQLQLPVLLQELERTATRSHTPEVAKHLSAAIALVSEAQGSIHTYVRFVGD